jgi:hypothetical protein
MTCDYQGKFVFCGRLFRDKHNRMDILLMIRGDINILHSDPAKIGLQKGCPDTTYQYQSQSDTD